MRNHRNYLYLAPAWANQKQSFLSSQSYAPASLLDSWPSPPRLVLAWVGLPRLASLASLSPRLARLLVPRSSHRVSPRLALAWVGLALSVIDVRLSAARLLDSRPAGLWDAGL